MAEAQTTTSTPPSSNDDAALALADAVITGSDTGVVRARRRITDVHLAHLQRVMAETPTAEAVLADAMRPESPLHELYDWDDSSAAYKWRLAQTRVMIRFVQMTVRTETTVVTIPVYVRNPDLPARQQGYVLVSALQSDFERSQRLVRQELARVEADLRRASRFADVLGLSDEFQTALDRILVLRSRVAPVEATPEMPAETVSEATQ